MVDPDWIWPAGLVMGCLLIAYVGREPKSPPSGKPRKITCTRVRVDGGPRRRYGIRGPPGSC